MYIRQVKTDERDSFIIADVIRFGRYNEGGLPPSKLYELREMCRARFYIVDMVSDLKKKVICLLDQVFPEYESLFSNIFGLTSTELLQQYSTPEEILAIDTEKLAAIIKVTSNKRFGIAKAEEIKHAAANSFGILMGIESMSMLIKQLTLQVLLGMDMLKIKQETSQYVLRHLRKTQQHQHVLIVEITKTGQIKQLL